MNEQRKRILVVDDNQMNTDLLKRRLERRGYEVFTASSGSQALQLIDQNPVDLVLLDVMMPEMNGIEVLQAIRLTRAPHVLPVIMATAKADSEDVVEALDKGANDYVIKPIELETLLARMRAHMRHGVRPSVRPSAAAPPIGVGVVLDQKYRLDTILGQGGFGTVYRAVHLALGKEVAVKVLHPDLMQSKEIVSRFRQEGVSACRVRHLNAVVVLDAGTTPEGVPYLVMELLEGNSLAEELGTVGALRLRRCVEIIDPVCNALREAHACGIIHRDIKPANILLSIGPAGEEVVKVLDFGIAKLMESQPSEAHTLTQGAGTPRYMAPERLLGEFSDAKADVYSIGVTLFEMLCGTLPFPKLSGSAVQQAVQQLRATPTSVMVVRPDLPRELARMVMSTLSRDRSERPDLDTLQAAVDDWARRWSEPEWPVPGLGAYLAAQGSAEVQSSGAVGDAPTQVETPHELLKVLEQSSELSSDLESGERPTRQSEELPEANKRGR